MADSENEIRRVPGLDWFTPDRSYWGDLRTLWNLHAHRQGFIQRLATNFEPTHYRSYSGRFADLCDFAPSH